MSMEASIFCDNTFTRGTILLNAEPHRIQLLRMLQYYILKTVDLVAARQLRVQMQLD